MPRRRRLRRLHLQRTLERLFRESGARCGGALPGRDIGHGPGRRSGAAGCGRGAGVRARLSAARRSWLPRPTWRGGSASSTPPTASRRSSCGTPRTGGARPVTRWARCALPARRRLCPTGRRPGSTMPSLPARWRPWTGARPTPHAAARCRRRSTPICGPRTRRCGRRSWPRSPRSSRPRTAAATAIPALRLAEATEPRRDAAAALERALGPLRLSRHRDRGRERQRRSAALRPLQRGSGAGRRRLWQLRAAARPGLHRQRRGAAAVRRGREPRHALSDRAARRAARRHRRNPAADGRAKSLCPRPGPRRPVSDARLHPAADLGSGAADRDGQSRRARPDALPGVGSADRPHAAGGAVPRPALCLAGRPVRGPRSAPRSGTAPPRSTSG